MLTEEHAQKLEKVLGGMEVEHEKEIKTLQLTNEDQVSRVNNLRELIQVIKTRS